MHARSLHVPSVLIGILGSLVVLLSMSQLTPPSSTSWGPPKKSIVNVFEDQAVTIPAAGYLTVQQVSNDRWLTVTGTTAAPGGALRWCELAGATFTNKGFGDIDSTHSLKTTPAGGGSEVGWVFRPGSQVVLRNVGSVDTQVSHYALIGYETRD